MYNEDRLFFIFHPLLLPPSSSRSLSYAFYRVNARARVYLRASRGDGETRRARDVQKPYKNANPPFIREFHDSFTSCYTTAPLPVDCFLKGMTRFSCENTKF